ncbi:GspH/FimT family pseudopilin [Yunchengibacter salinarum]|uniref:GspH/FimT family pseudopilin n=1 Tax=Yunchengibacter salinarum TaxID=3133399 RepID=UPI0035B6375F
MRTSATGNRAGFTLIELLVVLALMGLVSGMVALTLAPANTAPGHRAAEKLAARLELVRQKAILTGELLTVVLSARAIQVERHTATGWQAAPNTLAGGARFALPASLLSGIRIDGESAALPRTLAPAVNPARQTDGRGGDAAPRLIFTPLGMQAPFEITIAPDRASPGDPPFVIRGVPGHAIALTEGGAP